MRPLSIRSMTEQLLVVPYSQGSCSPFYVMVVRSTSTTMSTPVKIKSLRLVYRDPGASADRAQANDVNDHERETSAHDSVRGQSRFQSGLMDPGRHSDNTTRQQSDSSPYRFDAAPHQSSSVSASGPVVTNPSKVPR